MSNTFAWLAPRFAACLDYRLDVVAVDVVGDLAYTVGFERSVQTLDGAPAERVLRVTQVYRLEDGDWRVVHRHGDIRPTDRSPHAGTLPATTPIAAPPG